MMSQLFDDDIEDAIVTGDSVASIKEYVDEEQLNKGWPQGCPFPMLAQGKGKKK